MKPRVKATIIKKNVSIRVAMEVIQNQTHLAPDAPGHIALATDKNNKLIGIVTDGDIRRALLRGVDMDDKVESIINLDPITFFKDLTPTEILEKTVEQIKQRSKKRLEVIITVDEQNRPYDIFTFFELWRKVEIKTRVVSIIGLGYVGLTLGLVLADSGFKVVGVDSNDKIVADLKKKKSHIHEPGINSLLSHHLNNNFFVQNKFDGNDSDVYIICVGTAVNQKGKVITKPLEESLSYLKGILKEDDLVILRSTVPVGTCRKLVIPWLEKKTKMKAGEDFHIAFAPERTSEGKALVELRSLPQIIGGYDKKSADLAVKIFNAMTNSIILVDDLEAAEMVKLLNNAYRDLVFAFANETALICDKLNLNSYKIIAAANQGYSRSDIPQASPGVGGYCLTKDPYILLESTKKIGYQVKLPLISRKINQSMIDYVCHRTFNFMKENNKIKNKVKIFVIGLAFKGEPETTDMRQSTSFDIIKKLHGSYNHIFAYDPLIKKTDIVKAGLKYRSLAQGFKNADCVLILNNHRSYKDFKLYDLATTMKKPGLLFDAWHIFDDLITEPIAGIQHWGI